MTLYYPTPLFSLLLGIIIIWLGTMLPYIVFPPIRPAYEYIFQFRSNWRSEISKITLVLFHRNPSEKEKDIWEHSDSDVCGIQLFALIIVPSVTALIGSVICWIFAKEFKGEIIWEAIFYLMFTAFIYAFFPSKEEIKQVLNTSHKSQWYWWIKGTFWAFMVSIFRFLVNVDYDVIYWIVFICMIAPWSDQPTFLEKIYIRIRPKKKNQPIEIITGTIFNPIKALTSTPQIVHQKFYLELLQDIIRGAELELIHETTQSFVVQVDEGHAIVSIGVDEFLLKQLRILHDELTYLWIDDKGFLTVNDSTDFTQLENCRSGGALIAWVDQIRKQLKDGDCLRAITKYKHQNREYLVTWKKTSLNNGIPVSFEGINLTEENLSDYNHARKKEIVEEAEKNEESSGLKYPTSKENKEMSQVKKEKDRIGSGKEKRKKTNSKKEKKTKKVSGTKNSKKKIKLLKTDQLTLPEETLEYLEPLCLLVRDEANKIIEFFWDEKELKIVKKTNQKFAWMKILKRIEEYKPSFENTHWPHDHYLPSRIKRSVYELAGRTLLQQADRFMVYSEMKEVLDNEPDLINNVTHYVPVVTTISFFCTCSCPLERHVF